MKKKIVLFLLILFFVTSVIAVYVNNFHNINLTTLSSDDALNGITINVTINTTLVYINISNNITATEAYVVNASNAKLLFFSTIVDNKAYFNQTLIEGERYYVVVGSDRSSYTRIAGTTAYPIKATHLNYTRGVYYGWAGNQWVNDSGSGYNFVDIVTDTSVNQEYLMNSQGILLNTLSAGSDTQYYGYTINITKNTTLIGLLKANEVTTSNVYIYNSSYNLILNVSFSGNKANISLPVYEDRQYHIVTGSNGNTYYQDARAATYPIRTQRLIFLRGVYFDKGGLELWYNSTGTAYNYMNILTTDFPATSGFNVTSNVSDNADRYAWNNGTLVNVSLNLLSFTFQTNVKSNCSARLNASQNYTQMVETNANYKMATTETLSHSYTMYDNISTGNHCVYISCINMFRAEPATNSTTSGCLNLSRNVENKIPTFDFNFTLQNISHSKNLTYDINCTDFEANTITYFDNTTLFDINDSTGLIFDEPLQNETGIYIINITCGDIAGGNVSQSLNYSISDATPTMSSPSIFPDPATASQTVCANSTYLDIDGDAGRVDVNWTVGGVLKKTLIYNGILNGTVIGVGSSECLSTIYYSQGSNIAVYFWAQNGSLIGTAVTDNITIDTPPTLLKNYTIPTFPKFNDWFNVYVNVSDAENNSIAYVNFTIKAPNGTIIINNINGTKVAEGEINESRWNSSGVQATAYGLWNWSWIASDSLLTTSGSGYFDTEYPTIKIYHPSKDYGKNTNIPLNYTITDLTQIKNCSYMIVNATNSSQIIKNSTQLNCTQYVNFLIFFNSTFNNQTLILNVTDSFNNTNSTNITFLLEQDTSPPNIAITAPTGSYSSTNGISLVFNASDKYLNSTGCWYKVTLSTGGSTGADHIDLNSCNVSTTFNVASSDTNYIMFVSAYDDANNYTANSSFSVVQPVSGAVGGGGGGGVTISYLPEDIEFEVVSSQGGTFYDFYLQKGGEKTREIKIINKKNEIKDLTFSCIGDVCPWVKFKDNKMSIPTKTTAYNSFTVTAPSILDDGDYNFKIKAEYKQVSGYLDVLVKIRWYSFITKELHFKPFKDVGAIDVPLFALLFFVFLIVLFVTLFILNLLIKDNKTRDLIPLLSVGNALLFIIVVGLLTA